MDGRLMLPSPPHRQHAAELQMRFADARGLTVAQRTQQPVLAVG
jgi:hypothetical protein